VLLLLLRLLPGLGYLIVVHFLVALSTAHVTRWMKWGWSLFAMDWILLQHAKKMWVVLAVSILVALVVDAVAVAVVVVAAAAAAVVVVAAVGAFGFCFDDQ